MVNTCSLILGTKYDGPVGIWYRCSTCEKQFHIPDFDENSIETEVFKFCPYCGKKVNKVING